MSNQLSPIYFDTLQNIPIQGNPLTLSLFQLSKESILTLGNLEHTGDWDPYLIIKTNTNQIIESETGYPEIIFGDFNQSEQSDYLSNYQEITQIGIYIPNESDIENPILTYIPLNTIQEISLQR